MTARQIWVGDNLELLATLEASSAQLVYMDPPFASGREYKAVLQTQRDGGHELSDAFSDAWHVAPSYPKLVAPKLRELLDVLETVLPRGVTNYLGMMAPRLFESWRVLDDRGALYVHCDPSASHYLKEMLDIVFGPENFRNEVIWRRTHAHSSSRRFGPVHDVLLYYTKSNRYVWHQPYVPYSAEYRAKYYTQSDERGAYQLITCTGPGDRTGTRAHYEWRGTLPPAGRHWAWQHERMEELDRAGLLVHSKNGVPRVKRYIGEAPGVVLQDVWADIPRLDAHSTERIGYETQKPIALLKRIIEASTDPGALVIDPFGGSGTTAVAAEMLGREWAIADASLLACSLSLSRVRREAGVEPIELRGFPSSTGSARALRESDPVTFGAWGTGLLGASIDRKRSSKSVTKGKGLFGREGNRTVTRSWVPLGEANSAPHAAPEDVPADVSVGFMLDHPRSAKSLMGELGPNRPDFRAVSVSLSDAISAKSRQNGLATLVERTL